MIENTSNKEFKSKSKDTGKALLEVESNILSAIKSAQMQKSEDNIKENKVTVDDETIKQWAKTKYPPRYANNTELMKICYNREHGQSSTKYTRKNIKDVKDGEMIEVKAIVAEEQSQKTYIGCTRCRRKQTGTNMRCAHCGSNDFKEYTWYSVTIGDNTGNITAKLLHPPVETIPKNDHEYIFRGRTTEYMGAVEITIDNIGETKENKELQNIINDVIDFFEISGNTIEKTVLTKWYDEQKFPIPLEEVIFHLKIKENNNTYIFKRENYEKS